MQERKSDFYSMQGLYRNLEMEQNFKDLVCTIKSFF